jgi:hypothetical protein
MCVWRGGKRGRTHPRLVTTGARLPNSALKTALNVAPRVLVACAMSRRADAREEERPKIMHEVSSAEDYGG